MGFAQIQKAQENVLFICFHITELCIDNSETHRAIHPCRHGWKKTNRHFHNKQPSRGSGSVLSHLHLNCTLGSACLIEMCERKDASESESCPFPTVA